MVFGNYSPSANSPAMYVAPGSGEATTMVYGAIAGGVTPDPDKTSLRGFPSSLSPPSFTVCSTGFGTPPEVLRPLVVYGRKEVSVTGSRSVNSGSVYCNVFYDPKTDNVTASLGSSADSNAFVSVHVADVTSSGVEQYHVGAIVLPQMKSEWVVDKVEYESRGKKLKRHRIRRVFIKDPESLSSSSSVVAFKQTKIVTSVVYDPHTLKYTWHKGVVLDDPTVSDDSGSTNVFTAVPLCQDGE